MSPCALRTLRDFAAESPQAIIDTPRTSLRILRQQSRSRPEGPTQWLDSPVPVFGTPECQKRLPDGLISSPAPSPPPTAWGDENTDHGGVFFLTQPRRLAPQSHHDDELDLYRQVCDVMLASPPPKLSNGHVVSPSPQATSTEISLLKQKQLHRIHQLQFEHPSLNTTPQRLCGASKGLRDILNSNATNVKFTPKPPPVK